MFLTLRIVQVLAIHGFKGFKSPMLGKAHRVTTAARHLPNLIVRPRMEIDPAAVVRPTWHIRATRVGGDPASFSSRNSDNPNVGRRRWRPQVKRDPLSVWRPARRAGKPVEKGQSPEVGTVASSNQISVEPERSEENAIHSPSGENWGVSSRIVDAISCTPCAG